MNQEVNSLNEGSLYSTEYRFFDARLGRWMSLDPLMEQFPWMSPFVGMDNNPISLTDPFGLESTKDQPTVYVFANKKPKNKFSHWFKNQMNKKAGKILQSIQKAKKIRQGLNSFFNNITRRLENMDRRMNSGIEQKSRTGIPILDNILNNAGGMNIYNSGADEGWGSNGRYTETKKQLESIDIRWLMVSRFASKSYKHYQQYKPTTVKPPKSNDPEEEGKNTKEDYEENSDIAESVSKHFDDEEESGSGRKPIIEKKTDKIVQLRVYKTYYFPDSTVSSTQFLKSINVKKSDLKQKYGGHFKDSNGDYGIIIK